MTIERTITAEGMPPATIRIELTAEELYAAFREQELFFRSLDAECELKDYCGLSENDMGTSDYEMNALHLLLVTGHTIEQLTNPDDPASITEELAERFLDQQDCDLDENSLWRCIIDEYFKENGWQV